MTYEEAIRWLYSTQVFGIKLGLETMQRLAAALDLHLGGAVARKGDIARRADRKPAVQAFAQELPQIVGLHQREPVGKPVAKPVFIHVAGTNGKGSVCAMIESILHAAGMRTGLYTSPHLVTFRERIRFDGEMISEQDVAKGLSRIREIIESWQPMPTFFEIVTALALAWFQEQEAQAIVLETGLGGRLDATNIVTPAVSVLTEIARDHEKYLGSTLEEIAAEKAGIIKPGVPVVSAIQEPEARFVIERVARDLGSRCSFIGHLLKDWNVGLSGSHQRWNAQLAMTALWKINWSIAPDNAVIKGLAQVQWPGRFQRAGERIILDGAHNPSAAQRLALTWREEFGDARATLILGVMHDKDVRGVCTALAPIAARVCTVHVDNPRSCSAEELGATVRAVAPGMECSEFAQLSSALAAAEKHPERVLIAGSLFLIGEALVALGLTDAKPERSVQ